MKEKIEEIKRVIKGMRLVRNPNKKLDHNALIALASYNKALKDVLAKLIDILNSRKDKKV